MSDITALLVAAILSIPISFLATILSTKYLIEKLTSTGNLVEDLHKIERTKVPRPGGPALILGMVLGELILFSVTLDYRVLAVMLVTIISGIVGLIDDFKTLGGVVKPAALIISSLPILLLPEAYSFRPFFPIFGAVRLPILYPLLILIAIPVTANTFNTLDVLNGAVSSFALIAVAPLLLAFFLRGDPVALALTIPFLASTLAFYIFHRYPSRIFPGDSGSLALGAAYGALVIAGRAEIVGIVAILPAILNSFLFLSSVKRFIEHRRLKSRPTILLPDGRISASKESSAPITLVRMILAEGPLTEKEVVKSILMLEVFSIILATLTALTIWSL